MPSAVQMPRHAPWLFVAFLFAVSPATDGTAQSSESEIFRTHEGGIFKVEVVETLSGTPYVIGTAFLAESPGRLLTNYHVVNDHVYSPDSYTVRLIGVDGAVYDATVVRVDPVNDLALVEAPVPPAPPLVLAERAPDVGSAVYSLGFPSDLSGTLVAGTFSGPIDRALGKLLHYSGSLSPGMSGGPTLDQTGAVVGVNVATSGNQLSYLVSTEAARRLLSGEPVPEGLVLQAHERLLEFGDDVHESLVTGGMRPHTLGPFEVPTFDEAATDCSATPLRPDGYDFTGVVHECAPADALWLDPDSPTAPVSIKHVLVVAEGMSRLRFSGLYSEWFQDVWEREVPDSRWASDYVCSRRNVTNAGGVKLRTAQCWRRREGLEGLYDMVAKSAVLGTSERGLVTTITMSGTTLEHGQALITRVVDGIRWNR